MKVAFSDKRPVNIEGVFYVVARDPETNELRVLKADMDDPNGAWTEIDLEGDEASRVLEC